MTNYFTEMTEAERALDAKLRVDAMRDLPWAILATVAMVLVLLAPVIVPT